MDDIVANIGLYALAAFGGLRAFVDRVRTSKRLNAGQNEKAE